MLRKPGIIILAILLLSVPLLAQQQDGSVLERRVSINEKRQVLSIIFDQISWQTRVYFSYDANLIDSEKKYSIEVYDRSLFSVLNELFDATKFKFTERENQVIITQKEKLNKNLQKAIHDSIPLKYYFLSAKLIDNKKGDPINYATISVWNKPYGTISNKDGDFLLKLHPNNILDSVVISCMGFKQIILPAFHLLDEDLIYMEPISIKIREIKVSAISPEVLLENIREYRRKNYSNQIKLMTGFYRETIQQDNHYISVSEAIIEILKAPYYNSYKDDITRLIKGRQSSTVQKFKWLNFKVQGGPYSITRLDIAKTMESFIDKEYQELYKYSISSVIRYKEEPVYVLQFHPVSELIFPIYKGEMYVHRETFAILHCNFGFTKSGLKEATSLLIKKRPKGVKARPSNVRYSVNYRQYQGKWQLSTAQTAIRFNVRSRRDKLNSEYYSVSDLLVTDINHTELKKFERRQAFNYRDIFVDMIGSYDPQFWENYNIIQPDEDLRNALKDLPLN